MSTLPAGAVAGAVFVITRSATLPRFVLAVDDSSPGALSFDELTVAVFENGPGSDRTRSELEPYLRDSRIRHVVTGATVSRGENWTNLIRAGSAPYVGILHDDDRWHPAFLERRVAFLEEHPSCGFAYSGFNVVDASGRVVGAEVLMRS